LYRRFVEKPGEDVTGHTYYSLPSTSPAYTISFEKKLEQWKLIIKLLEA
jgi:G:T/U-mismatch repair DNA glycosylase